MCAIGLRFEARRKMRKNNSAYPMIFLKFLKKFWRDSAESGIISHITHVIYDMVAK
jgi:hypothetical protein